MCNKEEKDQKGRDDVTCSEEQQPSRGYFIAGTWTKWRAIKMENEGWIADDDS